MGNAWGGICLRFPTKGEHTPDHLRLQRLELSLLILRTCLISNPLARRNYFSRTCSPAVSESRIACLSVALKVLKQEMPRMLKEPGIVQFWQSGHYNFNAWTDSKRVEKLR